MPGIHTALNMHWRGIKMNKIKRIIWIWALFLLANAFYLQPCQAGAAAPYNPSSALDTDLPSSRQDSDQQAGAWIGNTGSGDSASSAGSIGSLELTSLDSTAGGSGIDNLLYTEGDSAAGASQLSLQSATNSLLGEGLASELFSPNWILPLSAAGAFYAVTNGFGANGTPISTPEPGTLAMLGSVLMPAFFAFRRRRP